MAMPKTEALSLNEPQSRLLGSDSDSAYLSDQCH